jgi:copper homeostasis protein
MEKIVEICCGSYYDAVQAYEGNAKRIELNSALYLGGLTPTISSLRLTKANTDLKVICMVRNRGGGFCYNDEDFLTMYNDCELLLENGADGIAFGFLDESFHIDLSKTNKMIQLIKKYNKETVFHRAFDQVENPYTAIEQLIQLGVDRVLTSGLKDKAIEGKELIKDLQEKYGEQIQILAGSGINASNAKEMMDYTKINQVHSSCKNWIQDVTTTNHVSFSFHNDEYDVVDKQLVTYLIDSIK